MFVGCASLCELWCTVHYKDRFFEENESEMMIRDVYILLFTRNHPKKRNCRRTRRLSSRPRRSLV